MRVVKWATCVAAAVALLPGMASAQTLKVVMHSDVKILDPIWTTAYIVRNHGYMIYDTLFAADDKLTVKPQMVDSWKVSDDKLAYTFTLRDGLTFHDGQPVTSEDCIASIKRWATRDAMGQKLMGLHPGAEGARRQDLHADPQGTLRPGAGIARQALVAGALHHAQARGRHAARHADFRVHRLRSLRLPPRPVAGGRDADLRKVQGLQATRRAGFRPVGRQGGISRPRSNGWRSPIRKRRPMRC